MAKPNCLVKVSGNLLEHEEVIKRLKELASQYSLVILIGGGKQINTAFKERGFGIKFGPLGRDMETLEERQLQRDILEQNQALVQDLLDDRGVNARAIIPGREIGTVLCPENGDVTVLSAYIGFDKIFIFTSKDMVEKKKQWLKIIAKAFGHIEEGELDKIEVVGF